MVNVFGKYSRLQEHLGTSQAIMSTGHPKRTRWNVMVVVPPSLQVEPQTRDEHDKRLRQLQGPKQDFHHATG